MILLRKGLFQFLLDPPTCTSVSDTHLNQGKDFSETNSNGLLKDQECLRCVNLTFMDEFTEDKQILPE